MIPGVGIASSRAAIHGLRNRAIAILALAIPVLAGLGYLWAFGAPRAYLAVNAGALLAVMLAIALMPRTGSTAVRRILIGAALVLLFVPRWRRARP